MTNFKTIFLVLIVFVAGEFSEGFFGLDVPSFATGWALFLAVRSDLRIDELEEAS